jgi:hypothetical protein
MIAILRKDATAGLVSLLVLWPLLAFTEILKVGGLDLGLVLVNSCFVLVLTIASVLVNEIEEETNGRYRIFDGLPAKRSEIVGAKFSGALLLTLTFAASHMALVAVWSTEPDQIRHIRTVILSCGVLSLIAVGVLYVGVFSLGLAKAVAFLGISLWLVSATFIVSVSFLGWNVDSTVGGVVEIVGRADHAVIFTVGLLFYGLAWLIAVRCFSLGLGEPLRMPRLMGAATSSGRSLRDAAHE